jgi:hypothetical protein
VPAVRRGAEGQDRISLGARQERGLAGDGGRSGSPQRGDDRDARLDRRGSGGEEGNVEHSDRVLLRHRSGQARPGGSLKRPGGNATGITSLNAELAAKRLGLFRELAPNTKRFFTPAKPTSELAAPFVKDLESAAAGLGVAVEVLNANTAREIDAAFDHVPHERGCGMVFGPEGFFHRKHIAALALAKGLPTIFDVRDYVEAGALASYGSDEHSMK